MLNRQLLYLGGLTLLFFIVIFQTVRRVDGWRMTLFALFWLYLLVVASRTVFPIPFNSERLAAPIDLQLFLRRVNLEPFFLDNIPMTRAIFYNFFFNTLLTVPVGLGLPYFLRSRWWHGLLLGPLVGVSIEAAQLFCILLIRYPYRVLDINDVLANTLGAWIGFVLYLLLAGIVHLWRRGKA